MDTIRGAILDWYIFVASISTPISTEIQLWNQRLGIPIISALLLGLIGAAAPCQLSQSVGMLAFLGQREAGQPRWRSAFAYVVGKSLMYTALGLLAILIGATLSISAIPIFVAVRKALGPLMVVIGLAMVGLLPLRWALGSGLTARLREIVNRRAHDAPFLLGAAFGLSFCPTLFALFFGLLIPLSLTRPDGVLYPALFAIGTALPFLALLGLISFGGGSLRRSASHIGRGQRVIAVLAGGLLVVTGLHDTLVYWLL